MKMAVPKKMQRMYWKLDKNEKLEKKRKEKL